MKLFSYGKDGGDESTVSGFWLIEAKKLFSVALLKFSNGSREAYHSHAFNSVSWLLKGELVEEHILTGLNTPTIAVYKPSFKPIITKRDTFHKVTSVGKSYVITFRGPWIPFWHEFLPKENRFRTLTDGRKEVFID